MIENYVASFVEGRVRLRHPIFKDEQVFAQVQEFLQTLSGVESLKHNARTGSILLEYDEEVLDQETLLNLLKQGEQLLNFNEIEPKKPVKKHSCTIPACISNLSTREKRKIYNRTMAISLGTTAVAIGLGSKRIHVLAGSVFLTLSLWHIKRMHKSLL